MEQLLFGMAYIKLFFLFTGLFSILKCLFPKVNIGLCCGLFGGSFNRPIDELMMEKIKMLGFFNQSRGKDSCGYFNGKDIRKGVGLEKEFFDFVVKNGLEYNDNGNNVFIGHTRSSTFGSNSLENAHPFNVDDKLILAHNGTLINHWDLCRKYDVKQSDVFVDSLALGRLLVKVNYPILEEYEGAAALLMHRTKKPNSLYVYHGWSKTGKYKTDQEEERPLYWMKTPVGVYVSSMKEALEYIRANAAGYEEPKVVPHNVIMEIRNGVITVKPVARINRDNVFKTEVLPAPVKPETIYTRPFQSNTTNSRIGKQLKFFQNYTDGLDITKETYPPYKTSVKNRIYWYMGRYFESNDKLCEGMYVIKHKTGEIVYNTAMLETGSAKIKTCYFYKGIMMLNETKYLELRKVIEQGEKAKVNTAEWHDYHGIKGGTVGNFAKCMSCYSKYPVCNLPGDVKMDMDWGKNKWYVDGKEPQEKITTTPLFTDSCRDYQFANGFLVKVISKGNDVVFKEDVHNQSGTLSVNDSRPITPEIIQKAQAFEQYYLKVEQAKEALKGDCMEALEFYFEDIMDKVLGVAWSDVLCRTLIEELLNEAVDTSCTIKSLLDPVVASIEEYILDAVGDIDIKEDTDDEAPKDTTTEEDDVAYEKMMASWGGLTAEQEQEIETRTSESASVYEKKN